VSASCRARDGQRAAAREEADSGMRGLPSLRAIAPLVVCALALALAPSAFAGQLMAGVGVQDASWHVGASAGQYASQDCPDQCTAIGEHGADPTTHSTTKTSSYGIQSRLEVRAIAVQGAGGQRFALVKNDLYIPQDLLYRRVGQILESRYPETGISAENLTMVATHDHSSPYYSSPSWGVWTFQDVFDVRFYEYYAEQMARAVADAAHHMVPVRVGAAVTQFDKPQRHSFGTATADDGTPAGYPQEDTDHDLTVVRFDDISSPRDPEPLAVLVNYGLHGEGLEGNDLISADWVAPMQRIVDRGSGAVTIFAQNAVGTTEPERGGTGHPYDGVDPANGQRFLAQRLEFSHKDYQQADYAGHLLGSAVLSTWRGIGAGKPADPNRYVPFMSGANVPVEFEDRWYPGPLSHPYPGVSSCRTDSGLGGDPRVPLAGLPDCESPFDFTGFPQPVFTGVSTDDFERAGIPVPENYSAPSYTGLEEDVDVHLQAFRIGDMLFTVCSCEQWADQSKNIKTRTDTLSDNEYYGFDWTDLHGDHAYTLDPYDDAHCTRNGDGTYGDYTSSESPYGTGTWTCPYQGGAKIADRDIQHMRAQVLNPANGWNDQSNLAWAESERLGTNTAGQDTFTQIKGNYTHDDACGPDLQRHCAPDERSPSARLGYALTVTISMANDYNGYIASYREYQRGDHYRKALTGWGPHSSDYMASRLVQIGRDFKDPSHQVIPLPTDQGEERSNAALQAKVQSDLAKSDQQAQTLGTMGTAVSEGYASALRDDGGQAGPAIQPPKSIQRFDAALFTWVGGDNYTDNPQVRVQHRVNGAWTDFADQSGEVPTFVRFPVDQQDGSPADVADYAFGQYTWHWTADFEAFASAFDTGMGSLATPAGAYRFVVDGQRREGGTAVPYRVVSDPFRVEPWKGISVNDLRLGPDRSLSFQVGPRHQVSGSNMNNGDDQVSGVGIGPIDYPDTYSDLTDPRVPRFIDDARQFVRDPAAPGDPTRFQWYCLRCSFRPWLDAGNASSAAVTFVAPDGGTQRVTAVRQGPGPGARWATVQPLPAGWSAFVARGDLCDRHGDYNGRASGYVGGPARPAHPVKGMSCAA
jgi:hypothetical protein